MNLFYDLSREEAKKILFENAELAEKNNMIVVSIFRKDIMDNSIMCTDMMGHNAYTIMEWARFKTSKLESLGVSYAWYLGTEFQGSSGELWN